MRSPYLTFALVSVPLFFTAMQFHMVTVAIPQIIVDLDAPLRWIGWVVTIYTLSSAVAMPVAGKLADEWGGRRVFSIALVLFAVASLGSALAPNVYLLILARLLQGLVGGALNATAFGLIGEAFPHNRARAIGMISSVLPIGTLLGPNVGGVIVEHLGWRWTFALNFPAGLIIAMLGAVFLPRAATRPVGAIDFLGAGLLAAAISSFIYAFTELSKQNASPNPAVLVACLALTGLAGAAFFRRERRTANPIIDMELLLRREFIATNALNFLYGVTLLGLFAFIPLYLQTAYAMSPSESGFLLTPRALAMSGTSVLAAMMLPRTGYRAPIGAGLAVMGIGAIILSRGVHEPVLLGLQFSDFFYTAAVMTLIGLSYGMVGPALNNAAIELAPDRIASISGLRGTFRSLGGAVGTAVIVLVITRAASTEQGLELAFLGLGIVSVATVLLVLGIADPAALRARRAAEERAAALSDGQG